MENYKNSTFGANNDVHSTNNQQLKTLLENIKQYPHLKEQLLLSVRQALQNQINAPTPVPQQPIIQSSSSVDNRGSPVSQLFRLMQGNSPSPTPQTNSFNIGSSSNANVAAPNMDQAKLSLVQAIVKKIQLSNVQQQQPNFSSNLGAAQIVSTETYSSVSAQNSVPATSSNSIPIGSTTNLGTYASDSSTSVPATSSNSIPIGSDSYTDTNSNKSSFPATSFNSIPIAIATYAGIPASSSNSLPLGSSSENNSQFFHEKRYDSKVIQLQKPFIQNFKDLSQQKQQQIHKVQKKKNKKQKRAAQWAQIHQMRLSQKQAQSDILMPPNIQSSHLVRPLPVSIIPTLTPDTASFSQSVSNSTPVINSKDLIEQTQVENSHPIIERLKRKLAEVQEEEKREAEWKSLEPKFDLQLKILKQLQQNQKNVNEKMKAINESDTTILKSIEDIQKKLNTFHILLQKNYNLLNDNQTKKMELNQEWQKLEEKIEEKQRNINLMLFQKTPEFVSRHLTGNENIEKILKMYNVEEGEIAND